MERLSTVSEKDIEADGSIRRRYDYKDEQASGKWLSFAKAMLVGQALMVVKSMFSNWAEAGTTDRDGEASVEPPQASPEPGNSLKTPVLKLIENRDGSEDANQYLNEFRALETDTPPSRFEDFVNTETSVAPVNPTPVSRSNVVALSLAERPVPAGGGDAPDVTVSSGGGQGGAVARAQSARKDPREYDERDPERPNRLPTISGPVTLGGLYVNQSIIIGLSDLLRGAQDPDGDLLQVQDLMVSSGQLTEQSPGAWLFNPDAFDTTSVTFSYQIADGQGAISQVAELDLLPVSGVDITGTDTADRITGTAGDDRIEGKAGDDVILSREGNDLVDGGSGNDRIVSGSGDDVIYAGDGDDIVLAGSGNDNVFGGGGDDFISGDAGNDTLFGGTGNDTIFGGAGDDRAFGESGSDNISGGDGGDVIDGGDGDDILSGDAGPDVIVGGGGEDIVSGGTGDDVFVVRAGDGNDTIDGGDGEDAYDASAVSSSMTINTDRGTATTEDGGVDQITGIENIISGAGDDSLAGDDGGNVLSGNAGDDDISGAGGNDVLDGGSGEDTLTGGSGEDVASGGSGDDTFIVQSEDGDDQYDGGDGSDTYDASSIVTNITASTADGTVSGVDVGEDQITGIENIVSGSGDDILAGDDGANVLSGNDGDDDISGAGGNDVLDGGSGDDRISAGSGDDVVYGGSGDDVFFAWDDERDDDGGDDGDDDYDGGDDNDTYDISGTSADAVIDLRLGLATSDEIGMDILSSIEAVIGGSGNDIIVSNGHGNSLTGGEGHDIFVFFEPSNSGHGNRSRDRIEDFEVGDKIDVSMIDGDSDQDGLQRLTLRYDETSFDGVGQILHRYYDDDSVGYTLLQFNFEIDIDDDEIDFEIEIIGRHEFDEQNLIT